MLSQIITGEKQVPIKFHGNVKHIVFACNQCGKEFLKTESYLRKQSKKRIHACCFCSPGCRSKYMFHLNDNMKSPANDHQSATIKDFLPSDSAVPSTPVPSAESIGERKNFLSSFLKNLLGN